MRHASRTKNYIRFWSRCKQTKTTWISNFGIYFKVYSKEQLYWEPDISSGSVKVLYKGVGEHKFGVQKEMGSFEKVKKQEWERYKNLQGSAVATKRVTQKFIRGLL
jgi:hypothetical protein